MVARRKPIGRRFAAGQFDERWHAVLRWGHDYFAELPPQFRHGLDDHSRFPDEATLRQAWDDLKVDVLAEHAAANRVMPRRPWSWWTFEASEPRDESIPEHEQLRRMGELTPGEVAAVARLNQAPAREHSIPS